MHLCAHTTHKLIHSLMCVYHTHLTHMHTLHPTHTHILMCTDHTHTLLSTYVSLSFTHTITQDALINKYLSFPFLTSVICPLCPLTCPHHSQMSHVHTNWVHHLLEGEIAHYLNVSCLTVQGLLVMLILPCFLKNPSTAVWEAQEVLPQYLLWWVAQTPSSAFSKCIWLSNKKPTFKYSKSTNYVTQYGVHYLKNSFNVLAVCVCTCTWISFRNRTKFIIIKKNTSKDSTTEIQGIQDGNCLPSLTDFLMMRIHPEQFTTGHLHSVNIHRLNLHKSRWCRVSCSPYASYEMPAS